jgi:hypothetical protein
VYSVRWELSHSDITYVNIMCQRFNIRTLRFVDKSKVTAPSHISVSVMVTYSIFSSIGEE